MILGCRYLGLDVHSETIYVTVVDPRSNGPDEQYEFDLEHLDCFIARLRPNDHLALEATTNSYYIYQRLQAAVPQGSVVIANPVKLKMIAQSGAKTDRNDSRSLALLLALGKLPTVWVPDEQTHEDRILLYHRGRLIKDRTRTLNRIRSLLMESGLRCTRSSLKSNDARKFLRSLCAQLSPAGQMVLDSHLERLTHLEGQIQSLDAQVEIRVAKRPERQLLATLPGVASLVALTITAVIGTIDRFDSPASLANYAGMVPRVRSSAKRAKHGSITKAGSKMLRWAIVEAVQQLRRHSPSFRCQFRRLARRKGKSVATVACGRQLLEVIWCMLRRNEPFRETQPKTIERKERRRQQRLAQAQSMVVDAGRDRFLEHLSTLRDLADRGAPRGVIPAQLRVANSNGLVLKPSG